MRIKINENESYDIKFEVYDEMTAEEFSFLMNRLKEIEKIVCKNLGVIQTNVRAKTKDVSQYPWTNNKEECIKFLKFYYSASPAEKRKYYADNNFIKTNASSSLYYSRQKWGIKPQDVGLKSWPQPGFNAIRK